MFLSKTSTTANPTESKKRFISNKTSIELRFKRRALIVKTLKMALAIMV
ncbi:hypothetical protein H6768_04615 [Candidatus Peribacteria bacterium]|nr:hypothetical protein [Candidatus Peribacteria bacterium]